MQFYTDFLRLFATLEIGHTFDFVYRTVLDKLKLNTHAFQDRICSSEKAVRKTPAVRTER